MVEQPAGADDDRRDDDRSHAESSSPTNLSSQIAAIMITMIAITLPVVVEKTLWHSAVKPGNPSMPGDWTGAPAAEDPAAAALSSV